MEGIWGHKPGVNNVFYGPPTGGSFLIIAHYRYLCEIQMAQHKEGSAFPDSSTLHSQSLLVLRADRAAVGISTLSLQEPRSLIDSLAPISIPVPKRLGLKWG